MKAEVQDWLTNWFVSRAKIDKQPRESLLNVDYFEAGWLTSMEVVEFITEIEEHFNVQFSDRDMQDARFVSIAGLTELILERSAETSASRQR